jgi:glycosyltransferase involved in cell wall biosynthesis
MNEMKIQFLIRSLDYGGAERQLVEIAKGLQGRGHTVLVTTYYADGPLEKDLHAAGVPVETVHKSGRWDTLPFFVQLAIQMKRERPDVLHGYLPVPNLLVTICKPLLPRTLIVWGIRASNVDMSLYDRLSRMVFRAERLFSRFADLIIVNSNAGRDYYRMHGLPGDKMLVVPNGIDTERFKPDLPAGERLRAEWGVKTGEKLIGLVGRLDPMKDHPTFLKAAALFAKERNDVRFLCVGDGPDEYRSRLRELAHDLKLDGAVLWKGGRDDMHAVYNAMTIATSASSFGEGFSNVIGEAMACGIPCVATNVGDSALIVGDTGPVISPGDPAALSAVWRDLIENGSDARRTMGEKARQRIVEQFSVDMLVGRTEAALSNLARR